MWRFLAGISCVWAIVLLAPGCERRQEPAQQPEKSNEMKNALEPRENTCPNCGFRLSLDAATEGKGQEVEKTHTCENCGFPVPIDPVTGKVGKVKE